MNALLGRVKGLLEQGGVENAQREAEWIVEAVTGLDRGDLASGVTDATPEDESAVLALAERRVGGEPLQYVTGVAGFRHLELKVGPGVFIPRPETELVAGRVMDLLPDSGTVVEIGTGSGAIALSIAHERPDCRVWGTEYSPEALRWAKRNRDDLGLKADLVGGDLFEALPSELQGVIDVIVSNPPYVPEGFNLAREVMDFEPHVALFADDAGLGIIRRLVDEARGWLRTGGWLVLEIGEVQRDAVCRLLRDMGFSDVVVNLDMSDRPRITEGRWQPT